MPRLKSDTLTVWGAVGENGKVLVSSISAYRSVALRWASRYRNHHIEQLCAVPRVVDDKSDLEIEDDNEQMEEHVTIPTPKVNGNGSTRKPPVARKQRVPRKVRSFR